MTEMLWLPLIVVGLLGVASWLRTVVRTGTVGLVYRDGRFVRELGPGRHALFDPLRRTEVVVIPTVSTPIVAHSLSLMTRDQFAFRANVVAIQRIADPRAYHEARPAQVAKPNDPMFWVVAGQSDRLQPELASAMLGWAAARTLEEIIADPTGGLEALIPATESELAGVTIEKLLLTDLTVPPEVRKMFTEVERARREGLAQLERARGEQASLRALANAARALNGNPQLAQLRLLQTMESAKGAKTFVMGRSAQLGGDEGAVE